MFSINNDDKSNEMTESFKEKKPNSNIGNNVKNSSLETFNTKESIIDKKVFNTNLLILNYYWLTIIINLMFYGTFLCYELIYFAFLALLSKAQLDQILKFLDYFNLLTVI